MQQLAKYLLEIRVCLLETEPRIRDKRTLHFKIILGKFTHAAVGTKFKFFLNQCFCATLPLDVTRFENGHSIGKELVSLQLASKE
jgi:hypothetical protein